MNDEPAPVPEICVVYGPGLYWRVQVMDPLTYGVFFCLLTLFTTWVVSSAYKKMKRSLEHKYVFPVHYMMCRSIISLQDIYEEGECCF